MNEEQMKNEKLYQVTMSVARRMEVDGLISEEEYLQIDKIFLKKYRPIFGSLFSEIF